MSALLLSSPFEGHEVRVVGTPDEPRWVAADVCRALGIRRTSDALRRLRPGEKGADQIRTPGGIQEMVTVTEAGLYRMIFRSDKPDAQRFQDWVFSAVLPAIRRTGAYSVREGYSLVRSDVLREQQTAIAVLSDAYDLQCQAGSKLASLAASMLAHRRHSKPKADPRQKLIRFEGLAGGGDRPEQLPADDTDQAAG